MRYTVIQVPIIEDLCTIHTIGIKIGYFPMLERTRSQKNPLLWLHLAIIVYGLELSLLYICHPIMVELIVVSKKL